MATVELDQLRKVYANGQVAVHGASFDIRDGRVLTGPATRALQAHRVRLQGSTIEVALDPAAPPQPEPF